MHPVVRLRTRRRWSRPASTRDYGQLTHSSVPSENTCRFQIGSRAFTSSTNLPHSSKAAARWAVETAATRAGSPMASSRYGGLPQRRTRGGPPRSRRRPRRGRLGLRMSFVLQRSTPRPPSWSRTTPWNDTTAPPPDELRNPRGRPGPGARWYTATKIRARRSLLAARHHRGPVEWERYQLDCIADATGAARWDAAKPTAGRGPATSPSLRGQAGRRDRPGPIRTSARWV